MEKHLFEKRISTESIYEGGIFKVKKDCAKLENGKEVIRELVEHSGGVCVVPMTDEGDIIFVRQFRYGVKDVIVEVPAGKLNVGEDHFECGKRELEEEIGVKSSDYSYLGEIYPSPAYLSEVIHIYMAKGLTPTAQHLDEDEFLEIIKIPLHTAVKMVMCNEIKDAKTQIAILKVSMLESNSDITG